MSRKGRLPNPAHRMAKDKITHSRENLQFAHKAVVGSLEWLQRGEQFLPEALDQAHLAMRFLDEMLRRNGRSTKAEEED